MKKAKLTAAMPRIAVIALVAVIGFSMAACGDPVDDDTPPQPQSVTYVSTDSDGNFYTLVITENTGRSARYAAKSGDAFTFTVELFNNGVYSVALTCSGTLESAEASGTGIEINITVNGKPLAITIEGTNMTVISGEIVDDEGETVVETPKSLTASNAPEDWPDAKRWGGWADPSTTVTLDYSVASDGVITINVGGTALTGTPAWEYTWKADAQYIYTAVKDTIYAYSFEAWTDGADRTMTVQWYGDDATDTYHNTGYENELPTITITSDRKTYTITAEEPIPKSGVQYLRFQCANQTGTFYVKILSITPYAPEGLPDAERWDGEATSSWDPSSTVTLEYSVASDGVCTITVGGTAMSGTPAWDYMWKANANYKYTAVKDKTYAYSFEAWTDGAERKMNVQWYWDGATDTYHDTGYDENGLPTFTITSERKTYTITAEEPIPKSGVQVLTFNCANQTGTFYVKILSIKAFNAVEDLPDAARWNKWVADDSTATLEYSVADDGVCTITVGGTADIYKLDARYKYTAVKDTIYAYSFEAWADDADRTMDIHWYHDDATETYHQANFSITTERKTYTITGSEPIPKSGVQDLYFYFGDKLGTFYVKILSITPQ